jgi:hypothetical protein
MNATPGPPPCSQEMSDSLRPLEEGVALALTKAQKDNDAVYLERVPPFADLPPLTVRGRDVFPCVRLPTPAGSGRRRRSQGWGCGSDGAETSGCRWAGRRDDGRTPAGGLPFGPSAALSPRGCLPCSCGPLSPLLATHPSPGARVPRCAL